MPRLLNEILDRVDAGAIKLPQSTLIVPRPRSPSECSRRLTRR
jgi:hypothetical protein